MYTSLFSYRIKFISHIKKRQFIDESNRDASYENYDSCSKSHHELNLESIRFNSLFYYY
ncbi:hypothetical protein HMPREF1603_03875 [Escherichia coli 907892]|uniref:Uncharacterized protein n=1 Tax=Escherichia coli TaxID=562 RepID=A0A7D5G5P8_ECOLX|nr:hypothetical protein HMPREF1603_03875 [Escherichia coli 907892]QLG02691.1 hypothetical protein pE0171_KPC_00119 [Escherichia coli]UFD96173.1 hypothetical protein [Escherichia coli]WKV18587.1 hypothetical protein [Escherichia coli]